MCIPSKHCNMTTSMCWPLWECQKTCGSACMWPCACVQAWLCMCDVRVVTIQAWVTSCSIAQNATMHTTMMLNLQLLQNDPWCSGVDTMFCTRELLSFITHFASHCYLLNNEPMLPHTENQASFGCDPWQSLANTIWLEQHLTSGSMLTFFVEKTGE